MYGLEKEKKPFQFDLEVELKKDSKKAKQILDEIENNIAGIKKEIQSGTKSKEIDDLGVLLQGYTSAKKVISKALKS